MSDKRWGRGPWQHGKPGRDHALGCEVDHEHRFGLCCAPSCWCNQTPLKVLGFATGSKRVPPQVIHLPHPECDRAAWHPTAECRAMTDEQDGGREVQAWHVGATGKFPDGSRW